MRPFLVFFFLLAASANSHELTTSEGMIVLRANVAEYRLRVHAHHPEEIREPERTLLGAISIAGARLTERRCSAEVEAVECTGRFVFDAAPRELAITVDLPAALDSEHVHTLHAGDQSLVFTSREKTHRWQLEDQPRFPPSLPLLVLGAAAALGATARTRRDVLMSAAAWIAVTVAVALVPMHTNPALAGALCAVLVGLASSVATRAPQAGAVLGVGTGAYARAFELPAAYAVGALALLPVAAAAATFVPQRVLRVCALACAGAVFVLSVW